MTGRDFGAGLHQMAAQGIRVALDLTVGQLALFEVERGGRRIAPFARVPWADGPQDPGRFPPGMAPHLRRMSGDFFCAPFGSDDVEDAPPHGWTANAPWTLEEQQAFPGGVTARFSLARRVAGAQVHKVWTLRDGHPFLYQRHLFTGGQGAIPVAHHVMLDLRTGGLLRFSPKLWAETPATPLEPGHCVLAYPARSTDLAAFPGVAGTVDLTRYPIARRHEDFAMLIDDSAQGIGWVTALRPACADVALLLKAVVQLPQTLLWFSNGGRDQAPWCGQHVGVLGVEEACSLGGEGRAASAAPNRLTAQGIATALDLSAAATVSVATVIGALPSSATKALALQPEPDAIVLSDGSHAPFDATWLD